ncbi:reverse transcriptase domain-containing protein [Tanacetum coccineum]|uniref:Reverse transcriptase domain-containing protein n=1 Tax=Tanacetum coccineum TaxID=301880 RepID=A0ABQ4XU85_9ASTR
MAERTMEELLRAPTEGYGEAIVLLEINAIIFEIKRSAQNWYEKEPPNSILTWEDLVTKFVNQFFPPSKTTHLKNEISRFTQKFEETFSEAWEQFKELLRACPHHGFTELTQVDTFYNGLNENEQDPLNAAVGGNLLSKMTREASNIIGNKSKVRYSRNRSNASRMSATSSKTDEGTIKLRNNLLTLSLDSSTSGTLPSNTIPNPKGEMKAITTRSGIAYEGPSIPTNPSPKETLPKTTPIPESDIPKSLPKPNIPYPSRRDDQKSHDKASNQMEKIFQIFQDLRFDISFADALLLMPRFAPTIKSLLMNKEKLLELAKIPLNENCSAMLLKKLPEKLGDPGKFLIPCNFPGMDVCHALADLGASINLMPLSIWKKLSLPELSPTRMTLELADGSITYPKGLAEDIFVKVGKFHFPTDFVVVDFEADPRVPLILGRSFLRTDRALIDVYGEEITLRVDNEAITFNLDQTTRYSSTNDKSVNRIDIIDAGCEEYALEFLGFPKSSNGNPTPTSKPFTSEFILEEIDTYLKDDS